MKIKHYDYVEWLLYKNKALPKSILEEMEEHLYNCDICMEIFLSIIDDKEIEAAGKIVPIDFDDLVISKISEAKVKQLNPKSNNNTFNNIFGYYVAVASVTILLTLGGFYTNLVDAVPNFSATTQIIGEDRPNLINSLSEKIVNSTSVFIGNIENINRNKEEK